MSKETMNQSGSGVNMEKAALDAWRVQQYGKLSEETAYILAFLGKVVGSAADSSGDALELGADERLGFGAIVSMLSQRHMMAWCSQDFMNPKTLELVSQPNHAQTGSDGSTAGWSSDFHFPRQMGAA